MRFKDKVVVITGASSGIGKALAIHLAEHGAKVGLLARRRDRLDEVRSIIQQSGGTSATAAADIADRQATKDAIATLREKLGPVDVLIANAGLGRPTYLDQSNIDEVEQMFRINVFGVIYAIEAVLPEMLERRSGHLAAVSSLGSYKGLPGESGYCATKAAVNTYMEGLRIQLAPYNIAVTTICPGFVHTEMTETHEFKMPWVMSAEEAAKRIAKALHRKVKVYNFPWQTTMMMKFTRWMPDWMIRRQTKGYIKESQ